MKYKGGFTLIEILVVLVIISLLVSMAAVNTGSDPRISQLNNEAKRLKFFLEAISDEVLFQNKNLGFVVTKTGLAPYAWVQLTFKDPQDPSSQDTYNWQGHTGRFAKEYTLPEEMTFKLSIEGQSVILPREFPGKDQEIKPQFYILSSGEQTVASFELSYPDLEHTVNTYGSGVGRFMVKVNSDE